MHRENIPMPVRSRLDGNSDLYFLFLDMPSNEEAVCLPHLQLFDVVRPLVGCIQLSGWPYR